MKSRVIVSMIAASLLLVGCKSELEVNTKYSELTTQPVHTQTAVANIGIVACSSHEDSRKPSDSLIEVQQKIPGVFKGAKYKECYTKNMEVFASFEIPVGVGKADPSNKYENDINIISQEDGGFLAQATNDFYKRYRDFLKSNMISDVDMKINIAISNDSGKDMNLNCFATYVDGFPCAIGNTVVKNGASAVFSLSNVSADTIIMKNRAGDRVIFGGEIRQ